MHWGHHTGLPPLLAFADLDPPSLLLQVCSRLHAGLPPAAQLQAHWLDVHPSRPNVCAVGCSGGTVAVWDLRMQSAPLACTSAGRGCGDVWEVGILGTRLPWPVLSHTRNPPRTVLSIASRSCSARPPFCTLQVRFDANEPTTQQSAVPSVLFATECGMLGRACSGTTAGDGGLVVSEGESLLEPGHAAAVNSFDVEAGTTAGRDVVCVTDSCELVYVRRGAVA